SYLRYYPWGEPIVAAAGPLSNLFLAVVFGLIIRFSELFTFLPESFFGIAGVVVIINIVLAIFNLMPIPPLDGSKIVFALLPYRFRGLYARLQSGGIFLALLVALLLWEFFSPLVPFLFSIITGIR
ncbi:MAG: peptidase M50, partial [Parcubacteria group bacterium Gr01-1014_72]